MMTPDWKINELNQAEEPAKELLRKLGYTFIPRSALAAERDGERAVLLRERLKKALLRLNDWLTPQAADQVIYNLENVRALGMARNQAIHEYLVYGMPVDVDDASGRRTRTVRFFDYDYPEQGVGKNEYIVTTQMRIRRPNERPNQREDEEKLVIPDLVLFVNGIPLVVMEAKSPTLGDAWRERGVRQLLRYQEARPEWVGAGAPDLFAFNLLCVAHCGAAAVYAPTGAPENVYAEWKSVAPYTSQEVAQKFGVEAKGQEELIIGLLSPAVLLDALRNFVVYEPERGHTVKKVPRYQQYRAVTRAVTRMLKGAKPEERGGVVHHTQGSGKSLTMLWLATKLRREPSLQNPTIVIVTDRTQLDQQISGTFLRCGFPAPEHARSTSELRSLLTSQGGRTVMTTIQKFEDALTPANADVLEVLDASDNLIVMVDEAHRTQYGLLGARMSKALPNATLIGFTGTPIDKGFQRSTMRRFGPLIDQYTIKQAEEDGATVPIYYQARLPELAIHGPETLDKLFDTLFKDVPDDVRAQIRKKYASKEQLAEAEQRIQTIALDVAEHFEKHVRPNGFKAQVVAPSREAAVVYAQMLSDLHIPAYPIITVLEGDDRRSQFKAARELNQPQIIAQFLDPAGEPQVLVVVNMLLTGFDAPIEQVMYLDQGLREHNLLQAIARVNRPFTHTWNGVSTEKTYGLVVDYYGVSQELVAALTTFSLEDIAEAMQPLEAEDPAQVIDGVLARAEGHFRGVNLNDVPACAGLFAGDEESDGEFKADLYEEFNADYRMLSHLFDRFLPDKRVLPYVDRLARLTAIRNYVRAQYLRQNANVDWLDVSAKVKNLIDGRIDAQVRNLMEPVSILDREFEAKVQGLPHEEARASLMEHALRAEISERMSTNPVFYEKLSEQLKRIIDEMHKRVIDAAEACKQLYLLRDHALSQADVAAQLDMTEVSLAVYELLERAVGHSAPQDKPAKRKSKRLREETSAYRTTADERLKSVALQLEKTMKRYQGIIDWHLREDVMREMRRDMKRELRQAGTMGEDELDELVRSMVQIARMQASR